MKKLSYILLLILSITFVSCSHHDWKGTELSNAERAYKIKEWEVKTKMLDLNYIDKLNNVQGDINRKKSLMSLDSVINAYNEKWDEDLETYY